MTPTRLALLLAIATAIAVGWRWRRAVGGWSSLDWLGAGVLAVALWTFWRVVVTAVLGTLTSDWNASRLAPTFALLYGYDLYYPATVGPILNNVYGPVTALAFLPVTVFRTPTLAVLAGGVLQDAFVLGSLAWLVWHTGMRLGADRLVSLACALGACLLMARYWGTAYWISMVHADGPALALGLLACTALVTRDGAQPTARALLGSALAVILAVWTKQTAAPLPIALTLALGLGYGRGLAVRYAGMLLGIGVLVSTMFLLWFGRPMLFNMIELVSRHGWYRPGIGGLAAVTWSFLSSIRDLLAACGVLLAVAWAVRTPAAPLRSRAWVAPLLAAVLLLPTGALGANKLGGEPSSFHSVYYLIAGTAALLVDLTIRLRPARVLAWAFCVLAIAAAWQSGRCTPKPSPATIWQNDQQMAYEFALRHPGEAYFPWAPLASLLAEGRLYHFEYGMMDRYLGGHEPSRAHLQAHLPPRMHWIAAHARIWTFNHFFPDYTVETKLPELPGWIVRSRPQAAPETLP